MFASIESQLQGGDRKIEQHMAGLKDGRCVVNCQQLTMNVYVSFLQLVY
jgi:hypothetical protein